NNTLNNGGVLIGNVVNNGIYNQTGGLALLTNLDGTGTTSVGAFNLMSASRIRQKFLGMGDLSNVSIVPNGTSAGTSRMEQLNISGGTGNWQATLDIADNALVIDY